MEEKQKPHTKEELEKMKALTDKYRDQGFAVYGAFSYDVQGGDDLTNKDILNQLRVIGYFDPTKISTSNIKFLAKVTNRY
jgi:hypothetical protein